MSTNLAHIGILGYHPIHVLWGDAIINLRSLVSDTFPESIVAWCQGWGLFYTPSLLSLSLSGGAAMDSPLPSPSHLHKNPQNQQLVIESSMQSNPTLRPSGCRPCKASKITRKRTWRPSLILLAFERETRINWNRMTPKRKQVALRVQRT